MATMKVNFTSAYRSNFGPTELIPITSGRDLLKHTLYGSRDGLTSQEFEQAVVNRITRMIEMVSGSHAVEHAFDEALSALVRLRSGPKVVTQALLEQIISRMKKNEYITAAIGSDERMFSNFMIWFSELIGLSRFPSDRYIVASKMFGVPRDFVSDFRPFLLWDFIDQFLQVPEYAKRDTRGIRDNDVVSILDYLRRVREALLTNVVSLTRLSHARRVALSGLKYFIDRAGILVDDSNNIQAVPLFTSMAQNYSFVAAAISLRAGDVMNDSLMRDPSYLSARVAEYQKAIRDCRWVQQDQLDKPVSLQAPTRVYPHGEHLPSLLCLTTSEKFKVHAPVYYTGHRTDLGGVTQGASPSEVTLLKVSGAPDLDDLATFVAEPPDFWSTLDIFRELPPLPLVYGLRQSGSYFEASTPRDQLMEEVSAGLLAGDATSDFSSVIRKWAAGYAPEGRFTFSPGSQNYQESLGRLLYTFRQPHAIPGNWASIISSTSGYAATDSPVHVLFFGEKDRLDTIPTRPQGLADNLASGERFVIANGEGFLRGNQESPDSSGLARRVISFRYRPNFREASSGLPSWMSEITDVARDTGNLPADYHAQPIPIPQDLVAGQSRPSMAEIFGAAMIRGTMIGFDFEAFEANVRSWRFTYDTIRLLSIFESEGDDVIEPTMYDAFNEDEIERAASGGLFADGRYGIITNDPFGTQTPDFWCLSKPAGTELNSHMVEYIACGADGLPIPFHSRYPWLKASHALGGNAPWIRDRVRSNLTGYAWNFDSFIDTRRLRLTAEALKRQLYAHLSQAILQYLQNPALMHYVTLATVTLRMEQGGSVAPIALRFRSPRGYEEALVHVGWLVAGLITLWEWIGLDTAHTNGDHNPSYLRVLLNDVLEYDDGLLAKIAAQQLLRRGE